MHVAKRICGPLREKMDLEKSSESNFEEIQLIQFPIHFYDVAIANQMSTMNNPDRLEIQTNKNEGSSNPLLMVYDTNNENIVKGDACLLLGTSPDILCSVMSLLQRGLIRFISDFKKDHVLLTVALNVQCSESFYAAMGTFNKHIDMFCDLFEWLYPNTVSQYVSLSKDKKSERTNIDLQRFFGSMKRLNSLPMVDESELSPLLRATLRPYQARCVKWMSKLEGMGGGPDERPFEWKSIFCEYTTLSQKRLYFCPFNGGFYCGHECSAPKKPIGGGVLADEMGLGKSVEILALILYHQAETFTISDYRVLPSTNEISTRYRCACGLSGEDPKNAILGDPIRCRVCGFLQHSLCLNASFICHGKPVPPTNDVCTHCMHTLTLTNHCQTTLLVCPDSILSQWKNEIQKHSLHQLNVCVYLGVKTSRMQFAKLHKRLKTGKGTTEDFVQLRRIAAQLSPSYLSKFDIVLTTYSAMRSDLPFKAASVDGEPAYMLRGDKKYDFVPSPLRAVFWWRVCLDEAQEVESSISAVTTVALSLLSKYRWCITGTPIGQKGMDDMLGLVRFLGVEPFSNPIWWRRAIVNPLTTNTNLAWQRVISLFRYFMWRHSMHDVQSELQLPHKVEHVHHVNFTPIEKHFYDTLLKEIQQKMTNNSEEMAFRCLLQLRQACCHPQIAIRDHQTRKTDRFNVSLLDKPLMPTNEQCPPGRSTTAPMSLPALCHRMMSLARKEMTDEQRTLVFHLHAAAGLLLLKGKYAEAQSHYERVLQMSNANLDKFEAPVDSVQKLHALNGLFYIYQQEQASESRDIRLASLENQMNLIKESVLAQHAANLEAAYSEFVMVKEQIESKDASPYWWVDALKFIQECPKGGKRITSLLNRLKLPVLEGGACTNDSAFLNKIVSVYTSDDLQTLLVSELEHQNKSFEEMIACALRIRSSPTSEDIAKASDCSMCRGYRGREGDVCPNCMELQYLDTMEDALFSYRRKKKVLKENEKSGGEVLPVTRKRKKRGEGDDTGDSQAFQEPSAVIHALRIIANTIKSIPKHDLATLEEYRKHQEYFSQSGSLLQKVRVLWNRKDIFLKEYDELDQACIRMELAPDDEEIETENSGWQVYEDEIDPRLVLSQQEILQSEEKLRSAISKVSFLTTIEGSKEATCPICVEEIKETFGMLPCAHKFCSACSTRLRGSVKKSCPICRAPFHEDDLKFVTTDEIEGRAETSVESSTVSGVGSKLGAIIQQISRIEKTAPEAKCLVFSQWEEVLTVLEHGLRTCDISFLRLEHRRQFERVMAFRQDPSVRVLLLPLRSGAKGLNLTEASHVFFVEPVLNPATESQAIGRIRRMGQQNVSHIHFFVCTNTIEDRIYQLCRQSRHCVTAQEEDALIVDVEKEHQDESEEVFVQPEYEEMYVNNVKEHISPEQIRELIFE